MNSSVILGFLIGFSVFIGGIISSSSNWKVYLNFHAFLIVIGGTLAAALISFPFKQLKTVFRLFFVKVMKNSQASHIKVIGEVIALAKGLQQNADFLSQSKDNIQVPFLREAVELMLEGGLPPTEIDNILKKRAEVHYIRYEEESQIFKTIARFPPAFGLLGAVSGMIALMTGLGSPDSFKSIGPAMAVAMVATMYGIALANFVFVPLGENLMKWNKEDHLMRNIVIDSITYLREKKHPILVEENLKSYLLSSERKTLENPKAA